MLMNGASQDDWRIRDDSEVHARPIDNDYGTPKGAVRPRGLEPLTFAAAVRRSNPLSYGRELEASFGSSQFVSSLSKAQTRA